MKRIEAYETSDGKIFTDIKSAEVHDANIVKAHERTSFYDWYEDSPKWKIMDDYDREVGSDQLFNWIQDHVSDPKFKAFLVKMMGETK